MRLKLVAFSLTVALPSISLAFVVTGATTGLNTTDGSRPLRYDIEDFYDSGPAWDLYLLSLRSIQHLNQSELTSYFQISGKIAASTSRHT